MTLLDGLRLPWQQRPTSPSETGAHDTMPTAPPVARIWILSATGEREVTLRLASARVSDSLNDAGGLWIHELDADPDRDHGAWAQIPASEVLIAVPPPQPTDRLRRLHRTARRIRILVPPYEVTGSAHIQPGTDVAAYLLRHGREFVALTNATLHRDGMEVATLPVVVVNLRAATELGAPEGPAPGAVHTLPPRSFA